MKRTKLHESHGIHGLACFTILAKPRFPQGLLISCGFVPFAELPKPCLIVLR